jgi:hypothetical protein
MNAVTDQFSGLTSDMPGEPSMADMQDDAQELDAEALHRRLDHIAAHIEQLDAATIHDRLESLATSVQQMDPVTLHQRLDHLTAHIERLAGTPIHQPAWLRRTADEPRLPVAFAVLCAIALQAIVPHTLAFHPWWLLPTMELLMLVLIGGFRQTKIDRRSKILRGLGIGLVAASSLATAWSAFQLIRVLLHGDHSVAGLESAGLLLRNGGAIWLTNVIVFALWYWEMDRGGPAERACGTIKHCDFIFSQMTAPELVAKDWEPNFVDYFYLSFTNATAFSPTDTLPLSRWAKVVMMFQSAVSLATVALVIARAVNVIQ